MAYKALLWTEVFRISHIKWYKFYNYNLLVALRGKQGRTLKLVNLKHKDQASIQLLTLCLNLLVYFAEMASYFPMKAKRKKLGDTLSVWRNFRVDLTWWMGKKKAENKKQTFFERLYCVVFQFFIQKYYIWKNNTFWCGIINTKNILRASYAERSIK